MYHLWTLQQNLRAASIVIVMKLSWKIFYFERGAKLHKTGFEDMTNCEHFSLICSILKYYANGSDCVGDDYSTSVYPASSLGHSLARDFHWISMDPSLMDLNGFHWISMSLNQF